MAMSVKRRRTRRRAAYPVRRVFVFIGALCLGFMLSGCQQQMAAQPSYRPLETSEFFPNGQASRQLVAGTVARGHLEIDEHFYTGRKPGANRQAETARTEHPLPLGKNVGGKSSTLDESQFVNSFPYPVTMQVLEHGHDRYTIYCVVCHDPIGTGRGKIVERGYTPPPSYHIPRLRTVPVGHLFAVVSEGYGSMPSYAGQISPRDRWAIVAYVRALQLSQHFPVDQLTPEMKRDVSSAQSGKGAP